MYIYTYTSDLCCKPQFLHSPVFVCCQNMNKLQGFKRGKVAAIFLEAPPVAFKAKNIHGQAVGGFYHDLSPQLGSPGVSRGHAAISTDASTWIAGPNRKRKGVQCVCVCV